MAKAWLQFFRIVNLPTVPGDVLVGAAAACGARVLPGGGTGALVAFALPLAAACFASCALYLFGLADNDIVGAPTDGSRRPIPAGAISLRAAKVTRGLCLLAALVLGASANLPPAWWIAAVLLALAVVLYNRTKLSVLMGLCRGLNVVCGGAAVACGARAECAGPLAGAALLWTVYIAAVTRYSEGEERDPARRRTVGLLIGALVYLQLGALLLAYFLAPSFATRNLLLAGAGLLAFLRVMKRALPRVSAS